MAAHMMVSGRTAKCTVKVCSLSLMAGGILANMLKARKMELAPTSGMTVDVTQAAYCRASSMAGVDSQIARE